MMTLVAVLPASAHPDGTFYSIGRKWPPNANETWYIDNNVPAGAFRDRIVNGVSAWDNGAGGAGPNFVYGGVTTSSVTDILDFCERGYSAVFVRENLGSALGGGPNSALGFTPSCYNASVGGTFAVSFTMNLERTAEFGTGTGWYTGTGNPPENRWDLWSIVAHETGHATGFIGHFANATLCPGTPQPATTETMCGGNPALVDTIMLRTLEAHDLHTYANAY